jgi:N-acetylmuramoyl-L-alanine amidase
MKSATCLTLLGIGLVTAMAPGQSSRIPRTSLFGHDYVRLEDWARSRGGQVRWTVPQHDLKVTLPSGSLSFSVNSRKAMVKGTSVWLSVPVALNNGSAYVGTLDVVSALNPVFSPPGSAAGRLVKNIVLDPGHGGKDPGNQEGRQQEKQYTLLFAKDVRDALVRSGFKVSLTRERDTFLELPERPDIARRRGADLFLCLHFNSADGPGASAVKGVETYCMTPSRASSTNARGEGAGAGAYQGNRFDALNMLLAYQIQKAIAERTGAEDRGVKRARFAVLRSAEMPAAYVEGGFMTHQADSKRIYDSVQRRQMAQAVADGVLAYKRIVERQ